MYAEIIRNLAKHERVELIVNNVRCGARQARKMLERADALSANVRFHHWPTNRVWLRDSGCIFLAPQPGFARRTALAMLRAGEGGCPHFEHHSPKTGKGTSSLVPCSTKKDAGFSPWGQRLAIKFRFNAWAKYSNWRHDEKIGSLMAKAAHAKEIHRGRDAARAWCSKAARSTSTESAQFSPPKNACSAKCRNAIRTWRESTTKKRSPIIWARRTRSGWDAASSATIRTATSTT